MKTIVLNRVFGSDNVTLSYLKVLDEAYKEVLERKAVELPWKDNKNNISCIPANVYDCIAINRPPKKPKDPNLPMPKIGKYAILIKNVPGRSGILIHCANRANQLLGCIAPGMMFKDLNNDGIIDVKDSTVVMEELEALMPVGTKCKIKIVDTWRAVGNIDPKDEKRV